jgi:hypothetical protein
MNLKALVQAALVLLILSCANAPNGPELAGSGSESPNALRGTILVAAAGQDSVFNPVPGTEVLLYAVTETRSADSGIDYAWALADSTRAADSGKFILDSIEPGSYTLIFQHSDRKTFSGYFNIEESDDTVTCIAFLEPTQTIRGTIRDTADTVSREFYLGLVGTPYFDTVTTTDSFTFADIPAGKYKWDIRSGVIQSPIENSVLFADTSLFYITTAAGSYSMYTYDLMQVDSPAASAYLDERSAVPIAPYWGWEIDTAAINVEPAEQKIQMTDESYIIEYIVTENP